MLNGQKDYIDLAEKFLAWFHLEVEIQGDNRKIFRSVICKYGSLNYYLLANNKQFNLKMFGTM